MSLAHAIRPALDVAVIMRRERIVGPMSRWQTWRWVYRVHETATTS